MFPSVPAEFHYFRYFKVCLHIILHITAPFVFPSDAFFSIMAFLIWLSAFQPFLACGPFSKRAEARGPIIYFSNFIGDFKKSYQSKFRACTNEMKKQVAK